LSASIALRGGAVQTTLLGIAIALIIAIVAALVGPHYVDWNGFRPAFEAEATRLTGLPVRIRGPIDARLLPVPSLRWRDVAIGGQGEDRRLTARQLDVEFSLAALMRGEWRASEVVIAGLDLAAGLDAEGRIVAPAPVGEFRAGPIAIDRFSARGTVTLHDAASRKTITLADLSMTGDVRSAASARGEGAFSLDGVRHSYRATLTRPPEGRGARARLVVEPGDRPLSVDIEGLVTIEGGKPGFDGMLMLARGAGARPGGREVGALDAPWRINAKILAGAVRLHFEKIDAVLGAEENGMRLSGAGDLDLGASPSFHAVVSSRQFDLDRLLAGNGASDKPPGQLLARLSGMLDAISAPPLPVRLEVGVDMATLSGRPVQAVGLDLRGSGQGWSIDRFEARGPGGARLAATGRIVANEKRGAFRGTVALEASEPAAFVAWMFGLNESSLGHMRALRAKADIDVGTESLTLDAIRFETSGRTTEGRVVLNGLRGDAPFRAEAALKGDNGDLDAIAHLARGAGHSLRLPDEGRLSIEFDRVVLAGRDWHSFKAALSADRTHIKLDELSATEASGLVLDASASFDREAATARGRLRSRAPSLQAAGAALASLAPGPAARLRTLAREDGAVATEISFRTEPVKGSGDRLAVGLALDLRAGAAEARIKGGVEPFARDGPAVTLDEIQLVNADLGPFLGVPRAPIVASIRSPAKLSGSKIVLTGIAGTIAGTPVAGEATLSISGEPEVEAAIALDYLDLVPAFAVFVGGDGIAPTEPLRRGLGETWRGQIAYRAKSARIFEGIEAQLLNGVIRGDGGGATISTADATVGGGAFHSELSIQSRGDGVNLTGRIGAKDVDTAALRLRGFALPAGKVTTTVSFASRGRSMSAFAGSLAGEASVKLDAVRIESLDPAAFAAAVDAADKGRVPDTNRMRGYVEAALAGGPLAASSAQWAISLADGRLRADSAVIDAAGGRLVFSGTFDLAGGEADLRGTLTSTTPEQGQPPPGIRVSLRGKADAARRAVDASDFVRWMMARMIERDTKRLESLQAPTASAPSSPTTSPAAGTNAETNVSGDLPPLPPPINIRPPPGMRRGQVQPPAPRAVERRPSAF
jgi:large subunit ribosomal protein L24